MKLQPAVLRRVLSHLFFKYTGVSKETLDCCPPADRDHVEVLSAIMICAWLYQGAMLSFVSHSIFNASSFHISYVIGAFFIATIVLVIDGHTLNRVGYYHAGLKELEKGGLKLERTFAEKFKSMLSWLVRAKLGASLALLIGIGAGLSIYQADILTIMEAEYRTDNAVTIRAATTTVDAQHKATADGLKDERARVSALDKQVASARRKELRGTHPSSKTAPAKSAALDALEKTQAEEDKKLAVLKAQFDSESQNRTAAIRAAVEQSPDYVPPRHGLIDQLIILDHLTDRDPKVKIVVILIELVSFGLEAAALFAKAAYIPSVYAGLIAKDGYLNAVHVVDELMDELDKRPSRRAMLPEPAQDRQPHANGMDVLAAAQSADGDELPSLPKRPRGRPRKEPVN